MMIHFALDSRRAGRRRAAGRTAIVHLTPGLDGVSRAVTRPTAGAAGRGDDRPRPAGRRRPLACTRRQVEPLDPAPGGAEPAQGRRRGEIDVGDGTWTADLRERYADRIQAPIGVPPSRVGDREARRVLSRRHRRCQRQPGRRRHLLGLVVLDQNLLWRPRPGLPGNGTAIDRLYYIGASTHPGPGLGAGSGTMVAKTLSPHAASPGSSASGVVPSL